MDGVACYVQATRRTRSRLSHEQAASLVEALLRFPVQPITIELMRTALAAASRFGLSYWDAAVVEAARSLGCAILLSEDLSDGTDYGGVRVENPFAS